MMNGAFHKVLFAFVLFHASAVDVENLLPIPFYYWQIKPYIYEDANGQLRGMVVDFYEEWRRESVHCFANETTRIVEFIKYNNGSNSNQRIHTETIVFNHSLRAIYGPFLEPDVRADDEQEYIVEVVAAESTALVTKRLYIDFTLKFWDTLAHMAHLSVVYILSAIAFSMIYWLVVSIQTHFS